MDGMVLISAENRLLIWAMILKKIMDVPLGQGLRVRKAPCQIPRQVLMPDLNPRRTRMLPNLRGRRRRRLKRNKKKRRKRRRRRSSVRLHVLWHLRSLILVSPVRNACPGSSSKALPKGMDPASRPDLLWRSLPPHLHVHALVRDSTASTGCCFPDR